MINLEKLRGGLLPKSLSQLQAGAQRNGHNLRVTDSRGPNGKYSSSVWLPNKVINSKYVNDNHLLRPEVVEQFTERPPEGNVKGEWVFESDKRPRGGTRRYR